MIFTKFYQIIQALKKMSALAVASRMEFAVGMLRKFHQTLSLKHRIWFSDEAHFKLDDGANKQNNRTWARENPRELTTKGLHPPRVTVWCAMSSSGIYEPIFFDGNVNVDNYRAVIEEFIAFLHGALSEREFDRAWFMQDGATPHTAWQSLAILYEHFGARVISGNFKRHFNCGMDWPPYSPDLTPCDLFLWGYLKNIGITTNQSPCTRLMYQQELHSIVKNPGETVMDYCDRVKKLFAKSYPLKPNKFLTKAEIDRNDKIQMDIYIRGLNPKLKSRLRYKEFDNWQQFIQKANNYDIIEEREYRPRVNFFDTISVREDNLIEKVYQMTDQIKQFQELVSVIAKPPSGNPPQQFAHFYPNNNSYSRNNNFRNNYQPPGGNRPNTYNQNGIICNYCGKFGHESRTC